MSQSSYWVLAPEAVASVAARIADVVIVPGLDMVQDEFPTASRLVITSAALDRGPWATAHIAEGTALADELLRWANKVKEQGGQVLYLVAADFAPGVNNNAIVAAADKVVPIGAGVDPVAFCEQMHATGQGVSV